MKQSRTLQTKDLAVGYGKPPKQKPVLTELVLEADSAQLVVLLGANGTGKSTLLRTLAGMQPKLKGEVWLDGVNMAHMSSRQIASFLSVVLTERIQAGYLTVADLVAMGRHPYTDWRGRLQKTDEEAISDALKVTGLSDLGKKDLHELSDGQLQKTMIARALAQDGNMMLMDEPLVHLDIPTKWEIMMLLKRMTREREKSIVLATHELELGLRMADQVWLIDKSGRMLCGTPEEMVKGDVISKTFNTAFYNFDGSGLVSPEH